MKGYSLDEQIQLCRNRCEQNGWKVKFIFCDKGISAATTDRPKFQMMMQRAKEGDFDVVVFWKLDRFCRSLIDMVNTERKLRESGVSIHSLTESIDTTTSNGRFIFRTLANAAQWEIDMIRERTTMALKALAKQNKWPNRSIPLGYDKLENGYLTVNKDEAKLVQKIFREYIGKKSMPQLAFLLNKKGLKTKKGKKWTASTIKTILTNRIYIGEYHVCDVHETINEYKIIQLKTFEKAQQIRKRHAQNVDEMPSDRKTATVDKMFNEYLSFLKEEETTEVNAIS